MKKNSCLTPQEILEEKIESLQRKREWKRFLLECLVIAVVVYGLFQFVIGIAFISGSSMEPAFADGEMVVFYRLDREYHKDDIVVIRREGSPEYIKRIVAVGGDVVNLDEEGNLWVNDEQEERMFFVETLPTSENITYPYEVPEDSCFVLGDNRTNSKDSRVFGAVKKEEITGRVFAYLGMMK